MEVNVKEGRQVELLDAIQKRRSIRDFAPEEVPPEMIDQLLEAAVWAPTAGNVQPWRFVVVRDLHTRKELAVSALNQLWVSRAPVVIVVCADLDRAERFYSDRGRDLYAIQDTAAAVQNILLAAVSLGLGSCWVGAFSEARVSKILDLQRLRPLALVPVGYPREEVSPPSRNKPQEVTRYI